jgi:hypothetical protein
MKIKDLYDNYPEFYELWSRDDDNEILCDEFMRQQGYKSARFVITSKTKGSQTGHWYMDKDDYFIFNLLWAEEIF